MTLLEIAKETGDKQREVRAYENIGHACFVLNRHTNQSNLRMKHRE